MNNELLAVESLISRLARGETADGTPASYDDMLASKLEALSTSVDAGAKARRLGKQSSFERMRALRARRAASEEQVPTASPVVPTNQEPTVAELLGPPSPAEPVSATEPAAADPAAAEPAAADPAADEPAADEPAAAESAADEPSAAEPAAAEPAAAEPAAAKPAAAKSAADAGYLDWLQGA